MPLLTIASLTLREASRRKLLIAVAILTVVMCFFTGWGFQKIVSLPCGPAGHTHPCGATEIRVGTATILILLMFMFSFVLALAAAFVAAPSISTDIESGVLLSILPRPIRRSDVVIGKWLGLSALIALYAGLACGLEFFIIKVTVNYAPPHPFLAIVYVVAEGIAVLTLAMLLSTRLPAITSGIVAAVLFGLVWMGGIVGSIGAAFHNGAVENIGTVSSLILPSDGLWRGAIYNLEPALFLAISSNTGRAGSANPFLVTAPPTVPYVIWALAWMAGLLALATWSFRRREL
jgi:ABC-type transport system involved in multi-copper enzyme maturation permease subunit